MRFSTYFAATLLGSALASPHEKMEKSRTIKSCLSANDAKNVVSIYQGLIANYTAAAGTKYVADDFIEYSDSINVFSGQALGSATFATKAIFMEAQAANEPTPLLVKSIDAVNCDVIALRWYATFGAAYETVNGITVLKTTKTKGYWQIKEIDVEFNSLTYLVDIGGSYTL